MSEIDVFIELGGETVFVGRAWSHRRRGSESMTFRYDDSYLAQSPTAYALDPGLPLDAGSHQSGRLKIFGSFSDSAPDRWGRRLMERNERLRARREGGERSMGELQFLLGVRDDLRQGALRFRHTNDDVFLAPDDDGVPPVIELGRLLRAAELLEKEEASETEVALLFRAGSSLGGARPKAHVRDQSGRVAIAKFPSPKNDMWDVIRWEAISLELASRAGITVPGFGLHEIEDRWVLVLDRFDRDENLRLGFVSAMTLVQGRERETGSYLDIAEVIEENGAAPTGDLHELWRRMAFGLLISNTDDHLRNHGFLRESTSGWRLSPAFDINPDPAPGPKEFATAIIGDPVATFDDLLDVRSEFRLDQTMADTILAEVQEAVQTWREVAEARGLEDPAIDEMSPAFEHERETAVRAHLS
jgi:serine/threonine-protein kinase HipA